jgi:hypothetical protein
MQYLHCRLPSLHMDTWTEGNRGEICVILLLKVSTSMHEQDVTVYPCESSQYVYTTIRACRHGVHTDTVATKLRCCLSPSAHTHIYIYTHQINICCCICMYCSMQKILKAFKALPSVDDGRAAQMAVLDIIRRG